MSLINRMRLYLVEAMAIDINSPVGQFLQELDSSRTDKYRPKLNVGRDYNIRGDGVSFNLKPISSTEATINSLYADSYGKGKGTVAMNYLCKVADTHGVSLLLEVFPFRHLKAEPMSADKLAAWYSRFGFVATKGSNEMLRVPRS